MLKEYLKGGKSIVILPKCRKMAPLILIQINYISSRNPVRCFVFISPLEEGIGR